MEFQRRTGPFIYVGLALSALAVAILFTIPEKSIRLFAARLVAFFVDLAFLGLFTFAVVDTLFKSQALQPSAVVPMTIVWTWFLFFVLFEWWFAGTPGILLLGLRLRSARDGKITLVKSLARNLLTLIVPLIVAGRIQMIPTVSRLGTFAQWSIVITIVSVFPLSIAFSGGQSLPDMLLGITVFPKRSNASQYPIRLNRRDWLLLLIASVLTGVTFAASATYSSSVIGRRPLEPPIQMVETSSEAEARISAMLWSNVLEKFPNASEGGLQDLRLFTVVGDLPSSGEGAKAPLACEAAFRAEKSYEVLRAQINPYIPTLIKVQLFESLGKTFDLYINRPGFLVLKLSSKESFGVFNFEHSENYTFCLMDSEGKPVNDFVDASASLLVPASIFEPTLLILGKLDTYSQVEKVPIWPR